MYSRYIYIFNLTIFKKFITEYKTILNYLCFFIQKKSFSKLVEKNV